MCGYAAYLPTFYSLPLLEWRKSRFAWWIIHQNIAETGISKVRPDWQHHIVHHLGGSWYVGGDPTSQKSRSYLCTMVHNTGWWCTMQMVHTVARYCWNVAQCRFHKRNYTFTAQTSNTPHFYARLQILKAGKRFTFMIDSHPIYQYISI